MPYPTYTQEKRGKEPPSIKTEKKKKVIPHLTGRILSPLKRRNWPTKGKRKGPYIFSPTTRQKGKKKRKNPSAAKKRLKRKKESPPKKKKRKNKRLHQFFITKEKEKACPGNLTRGHRDWKKGKEKNYVPISSKKRERNSNPELGEKKLYTSKKGGRGM